MSIINDTFTIEDGPDRGVLCDAFEHAYDATAKTPIEFSLAYGYTQLPNSPTAAYRRFDVQDFVIQGLEHDDWTGRQIKLWGRCKAGINKDGNGLSYYNCLFSGIYDTRTRKGRMRLEES